MNYWIDEKTAEYNRQQIVDAFEQIRLERMATRSYVYRPGLFSRGMYSLANWMISTGKQLRRRYEVPAVKCGNTESFAQ